MASFYGEVRGNRGIAYRVGSRASGIKVSAQSFNGSIIVKLDYNEAGELIAKISVDKTDSANCGDTIFRGTIEELCAKLGGK